MDVSVPNRSPLTARPKIKRTQLGSDTINLLGWQMPTGRPLKQVADRTLDHLLTSSTAGPILRRVINDGVELILGCQWSANDLGDDQLQLMTDVVQAAVEDAMTEDGHWVGRIRRLQLTRQPRHSVETGKLYTNTQWSSC